MAAIVQRIRGELAAGADEKIREDAGRYFKEPVKCYGFKSADVGRLAGRYWREIAAWEKREVFELCRELFASGYCEESYIASDWLPRLAGHFQPEDLAVFREWIELYIDNWAKCDTFCNHTLGDFFVRFPEHVGELKEWALSPNRWMRRAAAVSLIVPVKKGAFLPEVFAIADRLLTDGDDMVRKGYGWLLKEASRQHRQEVFDYVCRQRHIMPRTSLRYAVELMPPDMRAQAMRREKEGRSPEPD